MMYLKHYRTMGLLMLILLVLFVRESNEEGSVNVGVVIRITQNGLTYALNTILESIKKLNLSAFSIPSTNETTSHVNYSIQNLTFTDYADLNATAVIQESGLNITVHTILVNVDGRVECRDKDERYVQYCGITMTITGSGYFLGYIGKTDQGRFNVWVKKDKGSCSIPPPNLRIRYTDCEKPRDSICATNSSELEEKFIKEQLNEDKMCRLLRFYFFIRGNEEMNAIILTPRIKDVPFIADLLMQHEPKYESTFLNTYHKGDILWFPALESCSYCCKNGTINYTLHNDSSKMAYVWISKDVVQQLFEGVQSHGMLRFNIIPEMLSPGNPGLNTSCSEGVCVGRLVPENAIVIGSDGSYNGTVH